MAVRLPLDQVQLHAVDSASSPGLVLPMLTFEEVLSPAPDLPLALPSTVNPSHVYELNQLDSLTFLYNLLYDNESALSKSDILHILTAFKEREKKLPFSLKEFGDLFNVQGVPWGPSLRRKFYQERARIGQRSWFTNVANSREEAMNNLQILSYNTKTTFFRPQRFYSRLKNHITHFQLRLLVVCSDNMKNGIFYPSSYAHDDNLDVVTPEHGDTHPLDYHSSFKTIRLMPDESALASDSMKLDCLLDLRDLRHNSHSRISSAACSGKYLVSGTFEGGLIILDVEDPQNTRLVGEYLMTRSTDGITNHISIARDNSVLFVASNDAKLRLFDMEKTKKTSTLDWPFAVNCLAVNPHNPHQYFLAGDCPSNYIVDTRTGKPCAKFTEHKDFGFSCDWSPADENLLLSGNQDGTVKLWDRRFESQSTLTWNSALGSHVFDIDGSSLGGPVRNCKFSHYGHHVIWAESLDHVGIMQVDELQTGSDPVHSRVQSIDFIGKCIGLNTCQTGSGSDEALVIGVNDCPLGGILTYQLDAPDKPVPYDFVF